MGEHTDLTVQMTKESSSLFPPLQREYSQTLPLSLTFVPLQFRLGFRFWLHSFAS